MRFSLSLLLLTVLSGCQYDRSFLQMNSDSGVPFLGLQMSVDASDVQRAESEESEDAIRLVSIEADEPVLTRRPDTTRAQSPDWGILSTQKKVPAEFPNPLADVVTDEHQLTEIGRRLAAF